MWISEDVCILYIQSVHNLTDTHTYASYYNITHKLTSVTYVLLTYQHPDYWLAFLAGAQLNETTNQPSGIHIVLSNTIKSNTLRTDKTSVYSSFWAMVI